MSEHTPPWAPDSNIPHEIRSLLEEALTWIANEHECNEPEPDCQICGLMDRIDAALGGDISRIITEEGGTMSEKWKPMDDQSPVCPVCEDEPMMLINFDRAKKAVRCVNAHDGLVTALRAILTGIEESGERCWCPAASEDQPHVGPCEACQARAALEAAGEEGT